MRIFIVEEFKNYIRYIIFCCFIVYRYVKFLSYILKICIFYSMYVNIYVNVIGFSLLGKKLWVLILKVFFGYY